MRKILVTGATGQIGAELVPALRERCGAQSVVAAGHKKSPSAELAGGEYIALDVCDFEAFQSAIKKYKIDTIFHLAALLSAVAEEKPRLAWRVNMDGLFHALEICRENGCALFFPSSIGAFGPSTPPENTPQVTIMRPETIYGVSKVSGELLCDYYHKRFGVDARGLRFPGLLSYKASPGGGTTDYAVEIFEAALKKKKYECFLKEGTRLDMMYIDDAIRAIIELMEASPGDIVHRNACNITAFSAAPEDFAAEIKKVIPGFEITYRVDELRQEIAQSWPRHMDDSAARSQWGWNPRFDLEETVREMLAGFSEKLKIDFKSS